MFLPTNKQNRRQFLERSMLGFGSAFLLPSLLTGCTDHRITPTDPNTPIIRPPLGDAADWNSNAKSVITTGLQLVPDVGGFLGGLLAIIWPSKDDNPWAQVKAQVEALIDQKLADDDFNRITGNLSDMKDVITKYTKTVQSYPYDDQTHSGNAWNDAFSYVVGKMHDFQQKGDELLLLPLFVQAVNLYLGMLRDLLLPARDLGGNLVIDANQNRVLVGGAWGMNDTDIQNYKQQFQDKLTEYTDYVNTWYQAGRAKLMNIKRDDVKVEPFRSVNAYDRQMTMLVLDYMDTWKYYDSIQYPNGALRPNGSVSTGLYIPLFTREIYSDPYGNIYNFNPQPPVVLPPPATQFPTHIIVWGGDRIDAVQLDYPVGGGPGGVDNTVRMGDQTGGSIEYPKGGIFNLSPENPIIGAALQIIDPSPGPFGDHDLVIAGLQFIFLDGTTSQQMGSTFGDSQSGNISYDGYALSSIYIHGVNYYYNNSADCIVFGFMRWPQS